MKRAFELKDCLVRKGSKTNICIDCQNACGKCSWTANNSKTGNIRFEPVPGWIAEKVLLFVSADARGKRFVETYHITACPQFTPDKKRESDPAELKEGETVVW